MQGRRRWIGLLLVAVVGSLLTVVAAPAAAVKGVVDHPADYSACVGPAEAPAELPDVKGGFAEWAVNCIAYYGITKGTKAGLYKPDDAVTRWQMALFLLRAAGPAGIDLPKASDQGFTDLGRLTPEARAAINQLAELGIMPGESSTFGPDTLVSRVDMATMLSAFLRAAPTGPGGTDIDEVKPDDDNFGDLGPVRVYISEDILRLYEMGVTTGTTTTTFSPGAPVSRAQMAVFIARMLAHTNARPTGLMIQIAGGDVFQNSSVRLAISLRDTDRRPLRGKTIDVFQAEDPTEAFTPGGACSAEVAPAAAGEACVIGSADGSTDASGNLFEDIEVGDDKSFRVWAWTGDRGDSFDEDTTEAAVLDIKVRSGASALEVSDDLPATATKVPFGNWVTFTFRLVDEDGGPVARPGVSYTVRVQESRDNGQRYEQTTIIKETGPDGSSQITFRFTDPSSEAGDVAKLDLDVHSSSGFKVRDRTTIGMVKNDRSGTDLLLDWAEEPAEPTTLRLSLTKEFRVATSAGDGSAATVRASLTDQYGGPVVRQAITFTSNDSAGVPSGVRRVTNSEGVALLSYQRDAAEGGVEIITARFGRLTQRARQYWVASEFTSADGSGIVRVIDAEARTIIVAGGGDALLIGYDENDQYNVDGKAAVFSVFEENLTVGDTLQYKISDPSRNTINVYTLTNG